MACTRVLISQPVYHVMQIYVAGDRVVTDPLCKPFSMGRCLGLISSVFLLGWLFLLLNKILTSMIGQESFVCIFQKAHEWWPWADRYEKKSKHKEHERDGNAFEVLMLTSSGYFMQEIRTHNISFLSSPLWKGLRTVQTNQYDYLKLKCIKI